MKDLVRSALQWFADSRLGRRVVDTLFRARARRRIVEIDQQSVGRCQHQTLMGLVHKAHTTRFGREHNFRRIRNAGDFRRLVPLRSPAELWREYWQPAFPNLAGATWPGPISYLAISSTKPGGPFPYIPISPALWAAHQAAALTALAFVMHARPRARLCTGRLFLLGSGTALTPIAEPDQADSVEAVAIRNLPAAFQRYALAPPKPDLSGNDLLEDRLLRKLVERSARLPVTCVAGSAERLARFFALAKRAGEHERIADIWPALTAVLYARGSADPCREHLAKEVGSQGVLLLEMYARSEGMIAIEDPRHKSLRLLHDHGIYFEFVPVDQIGKRWPVRHTAAEVKLGVPYALALSSPAGIWACLMGSVIRFERRNPPLLRLVETGALWGEPAVPATAARAAMPPHPFPGQPPHLRTIGSLAKLPGRPFRTALSALADRE
jgi:hypothetical protein